MRRARCWRIGRAKAAVLPVPVGASASRSRPASRGGIAASWIARLLHRHRWIGYVGLAIVLYVALHMIWEGHRDVIVDLGHAGAYNAVAPSLLDIPPEPKKP